MGGEIVGMAEWGLEYGRFWQCSGFREIEGLWGLGEGEREFGFVSGEGNFGRLLNFEFFLMGFLFI